MTLPAFTPKHYRGSRRRASLLVIWWRYLRYRKMIQAAKQDRQKLYG